jgi:hypothetical protein
MLRTKVLGLNELVLTIISPHLRAYCASMAALVSALYAKLFLHLASAELSGQKPKIHLTNCLYKYETRLAYSSLSAQCRVQVCG